jgi:hypothetical protein
LKIVAYFRLRYVRQLHLGNLDLRIGELLKIYGGVFHQGRSNRTLKWHIQVNFGLVKRFDFGVAHLEADILIRLEFVFE